MLPERSPLQLDRAPAGPVTVTVASNHDDVMLSGGFSDDPAKSITLTFDESNSATAQTVSVTVAEDDDIANLEATISLSASGGGYVGVSGSVAINVDDQDVRLSIDDRSG